MLGYLPLVVECGGPNLKALRRTAGQAEQAVAPRRRPALVRFGHHAVIALAMRGAVARVGFWGGEFVTQSGQRCRFSDY